MRTPPPVRAAKAPCFQNFPFALALTTLLLFLAGFSGCATPGQPVARTAKIPAAITNFSATQTGDTVTLSFTLPKSTTTGKPLSSSPEVDIYREFPATSAEEVLSAAAKPSIIIPPPMLAQFEQQGRIEFPDHLQQEQIVNNAGSEALYAIRTHKPGHFSEVSNLVRIRIFPAPVAPRNLQAEVAESGIHLTWSASQIARVSALPLISLNYSVFRAQSAAPGAITMANSAALQFAQIGETSGTEFEDAKIQFGATYVYYITARAEYTSGSVESEESDRIEVTPRNTFRPAPPSNVVAVLIPVTAGAPEAVDLSWSFGDEQGLAGYNVYRSETESQRGARLNENLLQSPAYRDASVRSGMTYFYSVTAVDHAGNESTASHSVSVTIPQN